MTSIMWGTTALPLPDRDGIEIEAGPIVAARRMLSGTLRVDVTALKARVRVRWSGLTAAQRATLRSLYEAEVAGGSAATLALPDGQSLTILAVANSWRETHFYDLSDRCWYTVTLEFTEV